MSAEDPTFTERMNERNGVRSVTVDGATVVADSIQDEIMLDRYKREINSQTSGGNSDALGLRFRKMTPPGGGG